VEIDDGLTGRAGLAQAGEPGRGHGADYRTAPGSELMGLRCLAGVQRPSNQSVKRAPNPLVPEFRTSGNLA